ncbi:MAG: acyltransferase family protein, partial [Bacillota bacterium]
AMAVSYAAGQDPSRLYFGTDTHGFSALIGATAACAVGVLPRALSGRYRLTLAASAILGGLFALAGIVVAFATMNDTGAVAYRGGILLVDVATAVLILIVCELHHERLARFLPARPLVWLGVRSYGLYLWHWPVVVLTAHLWPTPSGATSLAWGTVMIAVSLGMAAVSWRYVEAPAVRGTWVRSLGSGRLRGVGLRRRMVVVLTSLVLVFGLSAHAVATSPGRSSAESRIDAGLQALQAAASHTNPPPRAQGSPRRAQAGAAKPPAVLGSNITVLGDSVTVASAPALLDRFPGIRIDAKVGAQLWDAPAEVARLRVQGLLRSYVVVALGTNGDVAPYVLPQIVSAAGPGHWFVLVTAHGDRSWIGPVDAKLRSFAQRTPRTALADWDAATPAVRDFADDGIHPGPQGGGVFVDVIERALRHLRASA